VVTKALRAADPHAVREAITEHVPSAGELLASHFAAAERDGGHVIGATRSGQAGRKT